MTLTQDSNSNLFFTLLDSVLTPKSAIYAAGPLDTGQMYFEALALGHVDETVRARNEAALSSFATQLRSKFFPVPVIDPGPLRVPNWAAKDVGAFFLETISRYAKEAWFIDGWEYSSGATKEYLHCVSLGIPCLTERGSLLTVDEAKAQLGTAVEVLRVRRISAPKLSERLNALLALSGNSPC